MHIKFLCPFIFILAIVSCNSNHKNNPDDKDNLNSNYQQFQVRFLDAYWKENPTEAINAGYGKYYDVLPMPDSATFSNNIKFCKGWLDSLSNYKYDQLNDDNKINYAIVQNELKRTIWYIDTFKIQQWNPSNYNIGGQCYSIITQNFAPLNKRLNILSQHLKHADDYYNAALKTIKNPTKEYTLLAIQQNEGSLDVFGKSLADSINASTLSTPDKDTLQKNIALTVVAVKNYITALQKLVADKQTTFRDFRIGKTLFAQKFKYDLVTDYTPLEIFNKATAAKILFHQKMFVIADTLWPKYCAGLVKPADSLLLIKTVLDKISLKHAKAADVVNTATNLIQQLQQFVVSKNLFKYDTSYPLKVRIMPAFMGGVAIANAEFTPPYLKSGITYYNVADITKMPVADAESELREYNNYSLQFLSIHEGMPGHCMQGVYSNKQSADNIIKSVFQNGAMIEGWAVYTEQMMMENGWGNNAPELWLTHYKWRLRELSNVLVDYGLQCLNYTEADVTKLLTRETFQEAAQVKEKFHRATVSQVQLCSYFTGLTDILALKEAYKARQGASYKLINFHEKFLSYGSSPVKYISEMMLK